MDVNRVDIYDGLLVTIPNFGKVEFKVTYKQENETIETTVLGLWTLDAPKWKDLATEQAEMMICFYGDDPAD